jgi:hypothetical protein
MRFNAAGRDYRIALWWGCTPLQEGRLTIGRRLPACPTRQHSRNHKSLGDARGSVEIAHS